MKNRLKFILLICSVFLLTAGKFNDHLVQLEGQEGKIVTSENKIRELAAKMRSTKDKQIQQETAKEIVSYSNDMKKAMAKQNEIENHIRYEHPEKGADFDLKYKRYNPSRYSNLEKELGLDRLLMQVMKNIEEKFPEKENQNK